MSPDAPAAGSDRAAADAPVRTAGDGPGRLREALGRLGRVLTRPLWRERAVERSRRWQRLALQGPVGVIVGVSFGILAAGRWAADPFVLGVAGAAGGFTMMYVLGQAESWLRARPRKRGPIPPAVLRIGGDLVGGALMGGALSYVLGTDAAASLAAGASLLVGYSFLVSHLLWGDVVDNLVRFASSGGPSRRGTDFSREQSLAARGKIDEALELYEQWADIHHDPAEPILKAAWMLREAGRWEEAVDWYRRALHAPGIDAGRAVAAARHIWEISVTKLREPALALPELERLLELHPVAGRHEWVVREIEELRGEAGAGG